MSKTRRSKTRGWKNEQPGYHQRSVMLKNAAENAF